MNYSTGIKPWNWAQMPEEKKKLIHLLTVAINSSEMVRWTMTRKNSSDGEPALKFSLDTLHRSLKRKNKSIEWIKSTVDLYRDNPKELEKIRLVVKDFFVDHERVCAQLGI